jgi:hypothetical protein
MKATEHKALLHVQRLPSFNAGSKADISIAFSVPADNAGTVP